jgi:hypothetical protein
MRVYFDDRQVLFMSQLLLESGEFVCLFFMERNDGPRILSNALGIVVTCPTPIRTIAESE